MLPDRCNSWYEATANRTENYPKLEGEHQCDVAIVGGGFTGLSAAYNLAKAGVSVMVLEQCEVGAGASGRNGGQLGTGHRVWVADLEKAYGFDKAKQLFSVAQQAKQYLLDFIKDNNLAVDYVAGHISVMHKPSLVNYYKAHIDEMQRFGYDQLTFLDKDELSSHLGSSRYKGGILDSGTGHLHPLKLLLETARIATQAGAKIYEYTKVSSIDTKHDKVLLKTNSGLVTAHNVLVATNAYGGSLELKSAARVMPIRSYIAATEPLDDNLNILPNLESVDDSRFVVRYFKKTNDGCLLFGGKESYTRDDPKKLAEKMHKQILEVYPNLKHVKITHAWGGNVAITIPRLPYVQQVSPNVHYIGGYSGHGVILSHFLGKSYSEKIINGSNKAFELMESIKILPFPGGRYLQNPLLFLAMTWYALLDRV